MREMRVTITREDQHSRVHIARADGTRAEITFPHKGPFPHDAVHYAVERGLGLRKGFWGMVAAGRHPETIGALAKAGGHASASRAEQPDAGIVELLQAERVVECFEAELWAGPSDSQLLRDVAGRACAASHVALPTLDDTAIAAIRAHLDAMVSEWKSGTLEFDWNEPA